MLVAINIRSLTFDGYADVLGRERRIIGCSDHTRGELFELMDIAVRRNAYGRQVDSFVGEVDAPELSGPLPAVFIRAPRIRRVGPDVEVLATRDSEPVLVAQGNVIAATFHPELTADTTVHDLAFGPRRFARRTA